MAHAHNPKTRKDPLLLCRGTCHRARALQHMVTSPDLVSYTLSRHLWGQLPFFTVFPGKGKKFRLPKRPPANVRRAQVSPGHESALSHGQALCFCLLPQSLGGPCASFPGGPRHSPIPPHESGPLAGCLAGTICQLGLFPTELLAAHHSLGGTLPPRLGAGPGGGHAVDGARRWLTSSLSPPPTEPSMLPIPLQGVGWGPPASPHTYTHTRACTHYAGQPREPGSSEQSTRCPSMGQADKVGRHAVPSVTCGFCSHPSQGKSDFLHLTVNSSWPVLLEQ